MSKVHIVQCLCPQRHALMAMPWMPGVPIVSAGDVAFSTPEEACAGLKQIIEWFIRDKQMNAWCGICKSTSLRYEDGVTKFKSLEEALPVIREFERQQIVSRALIEATRIQEQN